MVKQRPTCHIDIGVCNDGKLNEVTEWYLGVNVKLHCIGRVRLTHLLGQYSRISWPVNYRQERFFAKIPSLTFSSDKADLPHGSGDAENGPRNIHHPCFRLLYIRRNKT